MSGPSGAIARRRLALLLALGAGASSCTLTSSIVKAPGKVLSGSDNKSGVEPNYMAARLMRFADVFSAEIRLATEEFAQREGTPKGRERAISWRIDYISVAYRLATSQKPFAGLFDMIVLITALRSVHQETWLLEWGEADQPIVDAFVRLEEGVWALAGEALNEKELQHVHQVVDDWLARDPKARLVDVAKLPGFADVNPGSGDSSVVDGLARMVNLDPLSGLEPAVREVEQARLLGERLFFFGQRMPELLASRVELMGLRSAHTPQAQNALEGWSRISEAAASIAATMAELPAEREAALNQISSELTEQREGLVRDLETSREPLLDLLEAMRSTTESGQKMSDSLTETLRVLDGFVGRFDKKEASAPEEKPPQEKAPGRPFDITEYGDAAEQIGVAAGKLAETIATLDRSMPEVQRVLDETVARGAVGVDYAYRRALQLLGITLAGVAATVIAVRWISRRLDLSPRRGGAS